MTFYTDDHEAYRDSVAEYLRRHVTPHYEQWERDHLIDRAAWAAAGEAGVIGVAIPEAYGGGGESDYRFRMVVQEEIAKVAATSFGAGVGTQDDIINPYIVDLGTEDQKKQWLPRLAAGTAIGAIAMTEPGAGSDLQGIKTSAVRDGDDWVINGQKTFITNGLHADVTIIVAQTDPASGARGFTLFLTDTTAPGYQRGTRLSKIGLHAQDTAELYFDDLRLPARAVLGEEGGGFVALMERLPRERMSIAVGALTAAEAAYSWARQYVFEREAFGAPLGDLQTVRFTLAELETELDVTRAYIEKSVLRLNDGTLSAVDAAKAKWWASEQQLRVTTRSLQLFGGYGFMDEYPIARAFRDSRVQTIYGGTTEIMKEIIGRDIARRSRR